MTEKVLTERDGYIATVTLNNPDKLNALDKEMWNGLGDVMAELSKDTELRCVVLRGAGGKAFAAGADISRFAEERSNPEQAAEYHRIIDHAMDGIYECIHPTVALIEGVCVGGGMEVAACCDLRICGESSRFGVPIKRLGISMHYGELARGMEVVGPAAAREILLEGEVIGAERAKDLGFINRIVADGDVEDEAYATAARIAEGAPIAQRLNKKFIRRLTDPTPIGKDEHDETYVTMGTEDFKAGIEAFLAKKKPEFEGR
ncbi:MAG: enoyl-CoA hydratase [Rhodospirillaceae bacterium]|nr:enoyl-CoA hydratase [Rhodospirillaceae bacterium]